MPSSVPAHCGCFGCLCRCATSLTKSSQDPLLNLSARSCSFLRGIRPPLWGRCNNILGTKKNNFQPRSSRFLSPDSRPAMTSSMVTRKPPRTTPRMKNGTVLMTWALVSNISMMLMPSNDERNLKIVFSLKTHLRLNVDDIRLVFWIWEALCVRLRCLVCKRGFDLFFTQCGESVARECVLLSWLCPCLKRLLGGSPNAWPGTLSPDCQTSPLDSRESTHVQHPLSWDGGWGRRSDQWFVVGICACPTTRIVKRPGPWCG